MDTVPVHSLVNDELWNRLRERDPLHISRAARVEYCLEECRYDVKVLNEFYCVYLQEKKVLRKDGGPPERFHVELSLFLLYYLLNCTEAPLSGRKVSEKALKGGHLFFRGVHALATERIRERFRKDKDGFLKAGLALGGNSVKGGDAAFEIWPAPKVPVVYMLWMEDEEFPASVNVLFDATIEGLLPLDVIYGLSLFLEEKILEPKN